MFWFWLLVIGGFFKTAHKLLERVILKDREESVSFAFFLQASSVVILAPLLLLGLKFPKTFFPYLVLAVVAVLDTLAVFLIRESARLFEVSLRMIIYQIRIFFVLILAFLFLNEGLNFSKIAGSALIFSGITVAVFKRRKVSWFKKLFARISERKEQKTAGIFLTLTAAFVTAVELMGWKYLFKFFAVSFTLWSVSLISAFLLLLIVPNLTKKAFNLVKGKRGRLVFLDGFIGNVSWVLFFWATSLAEASKTLPISQGFTVLIVLGGIIFLKEKERIWQKILGGVLAAVGVVLVKGS